MTRARVRLALFAIVVAATGCRSLVDRSAPAGYDKLMSQFRSAADAQTARATAFLSDQTSQAAR